MKAIILAAGRGSRLGEHADDKPKCLNKIGGRTIIEWLLTILRTAGIDEIVIVTGYRAEMLEGLGVKLIHNGDWQTTNMVASLLCARKEFSEPVIVSYSDILYPASVVSDLTKSGSDITVVYDAMWRGLWERRFEDPLSDAESFRIDSDGRIVDIGKPVSSISDIQGQYIGLMRYTPLALSWIEEFTVMKDTARMEMTGLLSELIRAGRPVYGMAAHGGCVEIDKVKDLEIAVSLYEKGELRFVA